MQLRQATVVCPPFTESDLASALGALLELWITPGGRVELLIWLPTPSGQSWEQLDKLLEEQENQLAQVLTQLGTTHTMKGTVCWIDDLGEELESKDRELIVLYRPRAQAEAARWTERWLDQGIAVLYLEDAAPRYTQIIFPSSGHNDIRHVPAIERLQRIIDGELELRLVQLSVLGEPDATPAQAQREAQAAKRLLGWEDELHIERVHVGLMELVARQPEVDSGGLLTLALASSDPLLRAGLLRLILAMPAATMKTTLLLPLHESAATALPTLDVTDVLPSMMGSRALVRRRGILEPPKQLRLRVLSEGTLSEPIELEHGVLALEGAKAGDTFGLLEPKALAVEGSETLPSPEVIFRVVEPRGRVIGLCSAHEPPQWLKGLPADERGCWWAIRLDPLVSSQALREQLQGWPVEALLDASMILQDGQPTDLPQDSYMLRLVRVARWMRAAGLPVGVIAHDQAQDIAPKLQWLSQAPDDLGRFWSELQIAPPIPAMSLPDRLERVAMAMPTRARGLKAIWDNQEFRLRFKALIMSAKDHIHVQMYIVEDDATTRELTDEMIKAADRGVAVRLLIDSLYSRHGSVGLNNPLLMQLEQHPNIDVALYKPVDLSGSWRELKLRNHRKLIIIDHEIGIISGRNLGWPYLKGFGEVELEATTLYERVPWIDASLEFSGPALDRVAELFDAQWQETTGHALPCPYTTLTIEEDRRAWLVAHESMRDAHGVEAYRALIDAAREQIVVVNTFPLQFELQYALFKALARGVRVSYLVGNVRPLYGASALPFAGLANLRSLITSVIHGRLDTLAEAGARVYMASMYDERWPQVLKPVLPHVHAKVMVIDGRWSAVGSANLDITASYWESEALMVVDDTTLATEILTELDKWMNDEELLDPAQPQWQERAKGRRWLAQNWPSIVG